MRFSHNTRLKRWFAKLLFSVSLIAATCLPSLAQDWRTVHDGMEYAEVTRTIDNQPVRMNLLRLDLKKVRLNVVHAMDAAIGTETVSSMSTRHGAVAAINAGFFRLDKSDFAGDAAGLLVIDGRLFSESSNSRVALVFGSGRKTTTIFGFSHLNVYPRYYWNKFKVPQPDGINRERKDNEIILYTSDFGTSTKTSAKGTEIILSNCRKSVCHKFDVHENSKNSAIPQSGYVISIDEKRLESEKEFRSHLSSVPSKDNLIRFESAGEPTNLLSLIGSKGVYMVAGVPQLIKDSKVDITWQEEKTTKSFVETRHPRTAVAKLKDGKFLMITVDGRSESSGGISLNDLAAYLLELGATDAMNLDGGGSTTMFLDGKVVNHPSDKEGERKVSDALLVTLRKKN